MWRATTRAVIQRSGRHARPLLLPSVVFLSTCAIWLAGCGEQTAHTPVPSAEETLRSREALIGKWVLLQDEAYEAELLGHSHRSSEDMRSEGFLTSDEEVAEATAESVETGRQVRKWIVLNRDGSATVDWNAGSGHFTKVKARWRVEKGRVVLFDGMTVPDGDVASLPLAGPLRFEIREAVLVEQRAPGFEYRFAKED